VIPVAHARRLVEQDDDFACAAAGRRSGRTLPQKRPRERGDDERDGRGAHQQQRPVADAPSADRLVRDAAHEHQRRKLDDVLLLTLNEVNEDGNRDRAQAQEEERS